jgi:uncharacterized membrane protein
MARLLGEFVHIVSAMGVFCALGIEAIALYQDRRAVDATQAEIASSGLRAAHRIAPLAGAATVVSGWYLTQTVWGWHAGWITISLACVMIVAAISATTAAGQAHVRAGRTRARVRMSPSFTLRAGLLVGILFLMTVKPPFAVSLIAVTIAAGAGWLIGLRPMTAVAGAADPAPHTKSLHSDSAYDRPAVTDLNAKTVSLWLVVVIAAGIIFIGARFLVVPWAAAAAFGVPADDRSSLAYLWAKGSRDMVSGLLLLALVDSRGSQGGGVLHRRCRVDPPC